MQSGAAQSQSEDPFFVKVDGQEQILQNLNDIGQLTTNVREALKILEQTRDLKEKTLNNVAESLTALNNKLTGIADEVPRVEGGLEEDYTGEVVDESIRDLRGELDDLKGQLTSIEGSDRSPRR